MKTRRYQTTEIVKEWPLRRSQRFIGMVLAILLLAFCSSPLFALASDISGSLYKAVIIVSNNSTSANTSVVASVNLSSPNLIAGAFANASVNNVAMRDTSGSDVFFMPGYDTNDWMLFVDSIGASTMKNYLLYTAESTGGEIRWFPGVLGGNTTGSAGLVLGDHFTLSQTAYWNTDNGSNKYSVNMTGALLMFVSPSTSRTVRAWRLGTLAIQEQYAGSNDDQLQMFSGTTWYTQTFNSTAGFELTSIQLSQHRLGAPGDITVSIRRTDGSGEPIGNDLIVKATSANAWGAGPTWETVTFDSTCVIEPGVTYALVVRVLGGGAVDRVSWSVDTTAPAYNGGQYGSSVDSGVTWTMDVANDFNFRVSGYPATDAVVATGVTSANHTIALSSDGSILTLFVDGVDSDNATMTANVTDTGNDWHFFENYICPYVERQLIYVDGVLQQDISWEYTSGNFTDASGNGNDLIPTYRTMGSDPYVSTSLLSFTPITEAEAPSTVNLTSPSDWITIPAISGNFSTTVNGTKPIPGVIKAIADAVGTPAQLPMTTIGGFIIIAVSLALSYFLKQTNSRSLFIKGIFIGALFGLFIPILEFDFWMLLYFAILAIALAMASRHQEFSG